MFLILVYDIHVYLDLVPFCNVLTNKPQWENVPSDVCTTNTPISLRIRAVGSVLIAHIKKKNEKKKKKKKTKKKNKKKKQQTLHPWLSQMRPLKILILALADLNLRWAHMSENTFSDVPKYY